MSADGKHLVFLVSTPESGADVGILDLSARGPLLGAGRLIPRPSPQEQLAIPHFAGGKLYAIVFVFDPSSTNLKRRLVTIDPVDLAISQPSIATPANFLLIRLDPSGTEFAWTSAATAGQVILTKVGQTDTDRRALPLAATQVGMSW